MNDAVLPTKGFAFSARQEMAGLGGNVSFLKHNVSAKLSTRAPFGMVTWYNIGFSN
jgi:outer membrane protein assembly factor BamA